MKTTILALAASSALASAQITLYEQTFVPQNSPISASGWTVVHPAANWYSGTFAYAITDAETGQPINGQNPLYIGAGSASGINNEAGMFYVTAGSGGFSPIDPSSTPGLKFNIFANLQGGGADDAGYFAVQVGGQWYASVSPMESPTSVDLQYDLRSLEYDPAAANWTTLTLSLDSVTIGGAAEADLSGPITGVGIVHVVNNPPDDYSSWNYADYSITAVPEPSTLSLLFAGGIALMLKRRFVKK